MGIWNYEGARDGRGARPCAPTLKQASALRISALILIVIMIGFGDAIYASGGYEFIIYPSSAQNEIDALSIDLGAPRVHPGGTLSLTNRNGNLSLTEEEVTALEGIEDLIFVGSDSIGVYLDENGWNVGGVQ